MDDNAAALGVLVGGLFLVGIALFVWLIHTVRAKGRSWTWALLPGALSKCLEVLGQLVGGHDSQGLRDHPLAGRHGRWYLYRRESLRERRTRRGSTRSKRRPWSDTSLFPSKKSIYPSKVVADVHGDWVLSVCQLDLLTDESVDSVLGTPSAVEKRGAWGELIFCG